MWVAIVLTCEPDDLYFDDVYTAENRQLLSEKLQKAGFSVSYNQIEEGRDIGVKKSNDTFKRFIKIMKEQTEDYISHKPVLMPDGSLFQPE